MQFLWVIPFIKLQNNTVKQKNDEKCDGELSHRTVFWLSYAAFVSSALKTEDILLFVCFMHLDLVLEHYQSFLFQIFGTALNYMAHAT